MYVFEILIGAFTLFSVAETFFVTLVGFYIGATTFLALTVVFLVEGFEILGIYIILSGRSIFSNKYVSSKLNSYKIY